MTVGFCCALYFHIRAFKQLIRPISVLDKPMGNFQWHLGGIYLFNLQDMPGILGKRSQWEGIFSKKKAVVELGNCFFVLSIDILCCKASKKA